jgi:DNA-binding CsgD family transcriptional regulator
VNILGSPVSRMDIQAVLTLLADTQDLDVGMPVSSALLARLGELIPSRHVVYRENDLQWHRTPLMVDAAGPWVDAADEHYWSVGPCAITGYRLQTHDLTAARITDVVPWSRYRESAIYREYFRPDGVGHMLDLGLHLSNGRLRSILLCREDGDRDFSERDRVVLELLRPHLRARIARAELVRQAMTETSTGPDERAADPPLTPRERQIVVLVAEGKTNAEIATELWVTPATVKKHLENVYLKLGVGSRAAAAARLRESVAG